MSSVEIKIVGESGELLKGFLGKVNMLVSQKIHAELCSCAISFFDGEYTVYACTCSVPVLFTDNAYVQFAPVQ